jgi:hypothetical protein
MYITKVQLKISSKEDGANNYLGKDERQDGSLGSENKNLFFINSPA